MSKQDRAVIVYGNSTVLYIHMEKYDKETQEYIPFDMTDVTDLTVELICSKHATHIPLPYEIQSDPSILKCEIDYRLLHPNAAYGCIVQGYDSAENHFRFEMLPSELFLVVSNTSGLKLTDDIDTYDIMARVGWGITKTVHADWNCSDPSDPAYIFNKPDIEGEHDYSKDYLTFTALETITFSFYSDYGIILQYSLDNGQTWLSLSTESTLELQSDTNIMCKISSPILPEYAPNGIVNFNITGNCNVSGNIMSLLYGDDFSDKTDLTDKHNIFTCLFQFCNNLISAEHLILPATTLEHGCYASMFNNCASLTAAPELPATTLAESCYTGMFSNCASLTTAPELPATTLATNCYEFMFNNCTSLTTAPELPATTLAAGCYGSMFKSCSSLTTAPELPATTLTESCYNNMFLGCASLTTAPELPATTLAQYCYSYMFYYCTSLTTAPELPATTLANICYYCMFEGCSSLNYIKCLATDISADACTLNWVLDVAATGIFVKADNMSDWTTGNAGIPTGWTAYTESEYELVHKYELDDKQDTLVAGVNIKTINSQSLLGSGNIEIGGGGTQVNADWTETDPSAASYIQHKPDLSQYATQSDIANFVEASDLATVATSGSYNDLSNKPTIPAAQVNSDWNSNSGVSQILNKPDLSNYATQSDIANFVEASDLATVATSGSYNDLSNKPTIPAAQVNSDWNSNSGVSQILNKPDLSQYATQSDIANFVEASDLATVATSGNYNDLSNKPTIPAAQVNSDWNSNSGLSQILNKPDLSNYATQSDIANFVEASDLATVATSGSYNDLSNKPTIPASPVQSDWNESDSTSLAYIQNKPTIPASPVQSDWNESDSTSLAYIQNKPTIPASPVQSDWNESDTTSLAYIQNKPTIPASPVQSDWNESDSTSLAYIQNKPTISQPVQSDWNQVDSGALDYIKNKPAIPDPYVNDTNPMYQYFTITCLSAGTFTCQARSGLSLTLYYKMDSGNAWNTWYINSWSASTISLNADHKYYFKGTKAKLSSTVYNTQFGGTAQIELSGNLLSLLYGDDFIRMINTTINDGIAALRRIFYYHTGIISAKNLVIPIGVYQNRVFEQMFMNCTNLEYGPQLLFTNEDSYTDSCREMFSGCTSLKYLKCTLLTNTAPTAFTNWLQNVSGTGTFVKADNMTQWTLDSASGIPTGWTILNESDLEPSLKYETVTSTTNGLKIEVVAALPATVDSNTLYLVV